MTRHRLHFAAAVTAAIAAALLAAASIASAQENAINPATHTLGEHPAVLVKRQAQHVDPNHFIPAHPAGLYVIAAPSPETDRPATDMAQIDQQPAPVARPIAQAPMAGTSRSRGELAVAAVASTTGH